MYIKQFNNLTMKQLISNIFLLIVLTLLICFSHSDGYTQTIADLPDEALAKSGGAMIDSFSIDYSEKVTVAAERTEDYLPLLKGKKVAVVANHTTLIKKTHLIDSLLSLDIVIKKIFAPEHGFRGTADAGENIDNYIDAKTGLQVISLYGNRKKPRAGDLAALDIVLFDIQDVGVRFYTYISTLHYVMEACAEKNVELLILDRPNPNGFYVDGPVLDMKYKSFVGMHPVALVHGMTIAEYALMINGQGWLKDSIKCDLKYILCENYTHKTLYKLPVKPSPNLPDMTAVFLYPTLGLFEGTFISIGRGTDFPFQVIGHPDLKNTSIALQFSFKPQSMQGATNPKFKDIKCFGYDLRENVEEFIIERKKLYLDLLIKVYDNIEVQENFFNPFFYNLTGNSELKEQIQNQVNEENIRQSWENELKEFKRIRKEYLLYDDFEY